MPTLPNIGIPGVNPDTGASAAASSLEASGKGFLAGGPVGAVVAGVVSLIGSFAQHTARLHDAQNENAALDALIPAFDADIKEIADAYNAGQLNASDAIKALYNVDSNVYNNLRAQVGKPGTAWGGPSTGAIGLGINPSYLANCDTKCTVGCCVYLNDLRPAIFGHSGTLGTVHGLIEAIQNGGGVAEVPEVFPPKNTAYGNYTRPKYTIAIVAPSGVSSIADSILGSSSSGPSEGSLSKVESVLTGNNTVAILTVVGGLILIITALFGQNALRVK